MNSGQVQASPFELMLGRLSNIMNTLKNADGYNIRWFVCFGTLLHWLRDKRVDKGDLDLGVFQEDIVPKYFVDQFTQWGFELQERVDDFDGKPLKFIFKPTKDSGMGKTNVDIFGWVKNGHYRYHAYNINFEKLKKRKLNEYTFKGIRAKFIEERIVQDMWPNTNRVLKAPFYYGSLLDEWYPGWRTENPKFGQSASRYVVKLKKSEQWNDAGFIKDAHEASEKEYEKLLDKICNA